MGKIIGVFGLGLLLVGTSGLQAQTPEEVKAAAEAAKAQAEAQKAQYEAEAAAAKAKFGSLADYSNEGTVTANTGAGKLEASLLASEATLGAADDIAKAVCKALENANAAPMVPSPVGRTDVANPVERATTDATSAVFVVAEGDAVSFDAYDAFQMRAALVKEQLSAALAMKADTDVPAGGVLGRSTTGAVEMVALAANLFRSEYTVSNIDLTADDKVLTRAVMNAAACRSRFPFRLPVQYHAPTHMESNAAMVVMRELDGLRRDVEQKLLTDTRARTNGQAAATAEKDKAKGALLRKAAERYDLPIDAATKALETHASFRAALSTPTDAGALPLQVIARQADMAASLGHNGYLLVLKANVLGGSSYTKKNFWTFLGSMPFSVTGGTTASYTLIDGRSSNVVDSGVVARAAPYAKVHKTIARFENGYPASSSPE